MTGTMPDFWDNLRSTKSKDQQHPTKFFNSFRSWEFILTFQLFIISVWFISKIFENKLDL